MNTYTEAESEAMVCPVMLASYLVAPGKIKKPQCIGELCMAFQQAGVDIREEKQVDVYRCGLVR